MKPENPVMNRQISSEIQMSFFGGSVGKGSFTPSSRGVESNHVKSCKKCNFYESVDWFYTNKTDIQISTGLISMIPWGVGWFLSVFPP